MQNHNLTIDLKSRKDAYGQTFYVGKVKAPMLIDCSKGIVFLVFTSDAGDESLQICSMDTKDKEDDNSI